MSILKGQVPWRKRQRIEAPMHPATPPQPLRSSMSAPSGALELAAQPAEDDACDGDWSMQGPYNFDRWRDMIEKSVLPPACVPCWCPRSGCLQCIARHRRPVCPGVQA